MAGFAHSTSGGLRRFAWPLGIVATVAAGAGVGVVLQSGLPAAIATSALGSDDCRIKGNISSSGERIYHVPGQAYYGATIIEPLQGERWFCSEAEAVAAGWRASIR